jgi:hypothetical protein
MGISLRTEKLKEELSQSIEEEKKILNSSRRDSE